MPSQRTLARLRLLLWPVSMLYWALSWWRNVFYNIGFFITRRVSVPVLSVGNLSMGGTGKTPATLFMAQYLLRLGYKVGMVSRGYGRGSTGKVLVSDGEGRLVRPHVAGDEPYLLAKRLPQVPIVVDEDRYRGTVGLIEKFQPEVIILDDAFQHRGLGRDLDIVLLDASATSSEYRIFPSGSLRESLNALKRADLVVWTRVDLRPPPQHLMERVAGLGIPQIQSQMQVDKQLIDLGEGGFVPPGELPGEGVLAFCGIAGPHSFYGALMSLGLEPETVRYYPDHHRYSEQDLADLSELTEGGRLVVITTEKDAVKLPPAFVSAHSVYAVRIEFTLSGSEMEAFEAIVARHLPLPQVTTAVGEA